MNNTRQPQIVVLTGPPGGGKSTVIRNLALKGFTVLPEAHRWMRVFEVAESYVGDAPPTRPIFPSARAESLLAFELFRADTHPDVQDCPLFMDRSIIDFMGYCSFYSSSFLPVVEAHAREQAQGVSAAFYINNNPSHFRNDWIRRETAEEAVSIGAAICKAYDQCGTRLIHLPSQSVEATIASILQRVMETHERRDAIKIC